MTLREIQINFNSAMQKASRLEEIAGQIHNVAEKNMKDSLDRLGNGWQSDNATLYRQKGLELAEQINSAARDLEKIAASIRRTAENTKNAEMRAYELAQRRTYRGE